MNKPRLFPILFFLFFFILVPDSDKAYASGIAWYSNFDEAVEAAKASHKPMMLDFWAKWCGPCQKMEEAVYTDKDLISLAEKLVCVKINIDNDKNISSKYAVNAIPVIVFADSYGTELFRFTGYVNSRTLVEITKLFPSDMTEINRLNQILAKDKNSFDALVGMGKHLRDIGLYYVSSDYLGKSLKTQEARRNPVQRESIMIVMSLNYIGIKDFKKAVETFEKCLREFPNSEKKPYVMLGIGQAYASWGKKDEANKILTDIVNRYPNDKASQLAKEILNKLEQNF